MPPPKEAADDDGSSSELSSAPPRVSAAKRKPSNTPATPKNRKASVGQTPKSAPAATGPAAAAGRQRRLSQSQKAQPTLLTDFFLGRQTPARVDAQRRKNLDAAAVKAEMRTAMRQSSVLRIQQPNGVRDRVKAWQKSNAAAMVNGNPEASPSEPTDVAFDPDEKSVTEADRLRIKARQRPKPKRPSAAKEDYTKTDNEDYGVTRKRTTNKGKALQEDGVDPEESSNNGDDASDNDQENKHGVAYHSIKVPKGRKGLNESFGPGSPPKKRIVSDDNWMKRKIKTSPRTRSPKLKPITGTPASIPKDFLQRTAQNPSVQSKIKDWAQRVEPVTPTRPRRASGRRKPSREEVRGEDGESSRKPAATSWRSAPEDGTRIQPLRSTRSAEESGTNPREVKDDFRRKRGFYDDGIRVRPMQTKKSAEEIIEVLVSEGESTAPPKRRGVFEDGTRARATSSSAPDDGIRVRPERKPREDDSTVRTPSQSHSKSYTQTSYFVRSAPASTLVKEPSLEPAQSIDGDEQSIVDTPTRKPRSKRSPKGKEPLRQRDTSPTETQTEDFTTRTGSWHEGSEDSASRSGADDATESYTDSYGPSTVPPKSLAEIPVGYSAFSELDLPVRGEAGRGRARTSRKESFRGVPQVLKKVVSEGKKIIHDKVDPPKQVANHPPSIENWLDSTVGDPFVETSSAQRSSSMQRRQSTEEQWKKDARKRSISETRKRNEEPSPSRLPRGVRRASSQETYFVSPTGKKDAEKVAKEPTAATEATTATPTKEVHVTAVTPNTPETLTPKSKSAGGLKRSGATRSASSPLKPASGKRPFRERLLDAFRGESGVYVKPAAASPSYESSRDRSADQDAVTEESYGDYTDSRTSRRRSSGGSSKSDTLTTLTASALATSITESSDTSSSFVSSATPSNIPRRRPPPTSGDHELSTIVSVESYSTRPSDTMSTISESTVTQDTVMSKTTGDISRQRSQKLSTGLKRRLTKHADLVSVLSLPEDSQLPARTKSIKRARSLHRKTSKLDNATLDDLLQEFSEDESLYRRELKTLSSGVIPVLLTEFVHGERVRNAADIFGADLATHKMDIMSRAVVDMGVALEKLSTLHQFVPLHDAPRMVDWLEQVYPVYDNYLDVWRLGFQGIIVNLAPAAGKSAEEDSLVNGMDRNEDGDVLDENGERVDVAYMLRRPLVRIKWMLKFAKGVHIILGRGVAGDIAGKLEVLHEKARRRNREETARKTDEDASATDTTRTRDLRNLSVLDNVQIDQTRQVSAKDWFHLDMSHSNGQRLECQVEFVFRDKLYDTSDRGDILIRETGSGGRTWLLFPPIAKSDISARRGDGRRSLVVMIRDAKYGPNWYELVTITAEDDDTATDWLDILGTSPVPPSVFTSLALSPRKAEGTDVPVGERKGQETSGADSSDESPKGPKTPSRYHEQQRAPPTPTGHSSSGSPSQNHERTPTKSGAQTRSSSGYDSSPQVPPHCSNSGSHPLREDMRPDPAQLKGSQAEAPFRDDGAPPPPAHRTLGPMPSPVLSPPAEVNMTTSRIKRRTSSPLKHEYHPSDISSESDSTSQSSGSESDSSDDDLDEDDVPDTLPGISIKKPDLGTVTESIVSESSLTPSNSASQAGLPGLRASCPSEYTLQMMAAISYWSNRKGIWKDLGEPLSAIVITPGLIEAYRPGTTVTGTRRSPGLSESSDVELEPGTPRPLIALDLTPLVMIRQSTLVDLEIRSPVRSFSKYNHLDASIFRFRTQTPTELTNLYTAVHESRMNNAKFKALEEEARFRSFGQPQTNGEAGDDTSSRRRSWFGRKNSYRASTRAPSQSQDSSSSISATSFLRKFTSKNNASFNINGSTVDRQSRAGSGGTSSFYTSSGSSSAGGGLFSFSAPRSPSVSLAESSSRGVQALGSNNIKMRCHLQLSANKWEDHGNCLLTIARPPPGVRQELTIYHGLEKRVLVVSIPKKTNEKPLVVVDVVVGSACFSRLAARGIVLNVWEEMRDEHNRVGSAPSTGALSGKVRKWCFQFSSAAEASWVFGLVASEVQIA